MSPKRLSVLVPLALLAACGNDPPPQPTVPTTTANAVTSLFAAPKAGDKSPYAIDRMTFNETAFRLNVPVYWAADKNSDGAIDPDEVTSLLFFPTEGKWTDGGKFTPDFDKAIATIKSAVSAPAPTEERTKLAREELAQGATTLVYSDLRGLSPEEKTLVAHMLKVANMIDDLYKTQTGAKGLEAQVPRDDGASLAVFRRNWGPKCVAPKTEKNAACSAVPGAPKPMVSAYPEELQKDPKFCARLEGDPDSKKLLAPFVTVKLKGWTTKPSPDPLQAGMTTQPYSVAYNAQMTAIGAELKAAADDVKDAKEAPLKGYLLAASKSFTTNDWLPADEAWAKMNATNSKWYLRVAADEVYWDPCAQKAGFHLAFARINPDSLRWQEKLNPVEAEMETTLAAHIGDPYKARKVAFHLPDFIDVVFNAGDSRHAHGGTIGQSLPNWGKVAAEGRGRTVAMSNLFNDPDSLAMRKKQAESLLSKEAIAYYASTSHAGLLTTILHEATHNLGPAHEYRYNGQTDAKAFGGNMSSMLEELKAQTGGLYYVEFLRKKGIISDEAAKQTYVDGIVWAFGHISRGMYTESGGRKAYSQLAAIQVGFLLDEGALTWDANTTAANGSDKGAFTINFDKMVPAIDKMMKVVGAIKAKNDKPGAEELAAKYVDGKTVPHALITERELRFPKPSFVYAYDL
jgi:hypothetical protein